MSSKSENDRILIIYWSEKFYLEEIQPQSSAIGALCFSDINMTADVIRSFRKYELWLCPDQSSDDEMLMAQDLRHKLNRHGVVHIIKRVKTAVQRKHEKAVEAARKKMNAAIAKYETLKGHEP